MKPYIINNIYYSNKVLYTFTCFFSIIYNVFNNILIPVEINILFIVNIITSLFIVFNNRNILQELKVYDVSLKCITFIMIYTINIIFFSYYKFHLHIVFNIYLLLFELINQKKINNGINLHELLLKNISYIKNISLNNTCPICLVKYIENENVYIFNCDHVVHIQCYEHILQNHYICVCPICRIIINI
jgi:hypothetical protein